MKTKNFNEYLEKRLSKTEIKELNQQVKLEYSILYDLQNTISLAFSKYMDNEKIGFNEAVKRLHMSPTQINRIQKGEANLTLATVAHIGTLFKKRPCIIFKNI
jgi:hypothetical protein